MLSNNIYLLEKMSQELPGERLREVERYRQREHRREARKLRERFNLEVRRPATFRLRHLFGWR